MPDLYNKTRKEKDYLGELEIPADALYGINALRAYRNFENSEKFDIDWYKAVGTVKLACYQTYRKLKKNVLANIPSKKIKIDFFADEVIDALEKAAGEVSEGKHFEHFIVPAIQGGAGTSINMNVNEIIANRVLQILGHKPGDYSIIDPFIHANVFQSTNDVIPTSLKVAVLQLLNILEEEINKTRFVAEDLERKYRNVLRMGYTQMQAAVPSSYGKLFSTYNDALSRDWWRVSKCFERIKTVNLGGGAIGTGIAIPKYFIMEVSKNLQHITGLPITRSENMCDATSNQDSFVEIHATLKSHAVNLEKQASDIRLLASDISREALKIQPRQVGSSIMPGKINPVISEFIISIVHQVYANDILISNLCGQSCLELNAYMPSIGKSLIESLKLLIAANRSYRQFLLSGIEIDKNLSLNSVLTNPSITVVLVPILGYRKATEFAIIMKNEGIDIVELNKKFNFVDEKLLESLLNPENLLKEGFSFKEG